MTNCSSSRGSQRWFDLQARKTTGAQGRARAATKYLIGATHFMKNPIVVGIMVFSVLVAGCGKKSVADKEAPPYHGQTFTKSADDDFIASEQKVVDRSQVIAYACANTNQMPSIVLTVSEIWKGAHNAATLGITNGTQFSLSGSSLRGPLPDGAIMLIPQADSPAAALQQRQVTFVRSGRILDLTIKEYKTRLGI